MLPSAHPGSHLVDLDVAICTSWIWGSGPPKMTHFGPLRETPIRWVQRWPGLLRTEIHRMHMPLQWPLGPSGAIRCARRAAGLAETLRMTYFGSQNGSQIGRFRGLRGSRCCHFDLKGLKSRPPKWSILDPSGRPRSRGSKYDHGRLRT